MVWFKVNVFFVLNGLNMMRGGVFEDGVVIFLIIFFWFLFNFGLRIYGRGRIWKL